jgi:acetyl-CoA carboxylase biotin carboxylase subunit
MKMLDYYFIEMNTRIQVEHPVTEMITGIDIIREQILIASGEKLTYSQDDIHLNGHSIECRINAEDPKHKFRPSPGRIDLLHIPQGPGIRFDSFIYSGIEIPPYYDSMVGKLIVHGRDREEATKKMQAALEELVIKGIQTNQSFLYMLINQRSYLTGDFNTSYIEKHIESLLEYEDE